jgi:hypothetical protein
MDEITDIKERLIEQYTHYRSVVQPNYNYHTSIAFEKAFTKAAQFCIEKGITPEQYTVAIWEGLGDRKENFYPSFYGSTNGNNLAETYKAQATTSPEIQLDYQKQILRRHVMELKKDPAEVLMNPRIKFYAWFRILATKLPNQEIIRTYIKTAKAEMTMELAQFLKTNGLDVDRIL